MSYDPTAAELLKENAMLKAARETATNQLHQFLKDVSDDMECTAKCDSYGHDEECPVTNTAVAWRRLRERLSAVEAERDGMRRALEALVRHCSNSTHGGGQLEGMADKEKRMKWYEGLIPIRNAAREFVKPKGSEGK